MTLNLIGSSRKLARALFHLNALGDEFQTMSERAARNITIANEETEPHPLGSRHLFRVGTLTQPSAMVGPIVGDYVQNLRSALDHLAWELVQKGTASAYNPRLVQFPIYSMGQSRRRGRRTFATEVGKNVPGITRSQLTFLRKHQPFHRGKWHLSTLATLSNQDKHRILTPIHLFGFNVRRRFLKATKGRIQSWRLLLPEGRPVTEGTPYLEVIVSDPDAQVQLFTTLTTPVAFEEGAGRYHRLTALEEVGERVADIVHEAAARWGSPSDARVAKRWPAAARSVLHMDHG